MNIHKIQHRNDIKKEFEFSLCTIANNLKEYEDMKKSFELCGFDSDCEYLLADNSDGNLFDAYEAIRIFLRESRAKYILIIHQDVRCLDRREDLLNCLKSLSNFDPNWAVCGNAGSMGYHGDAMYLDNNGVISKSRNLPARVNSLDENFLIIKASADLTLSKKFSSFHLYGTELCLVADFLGYNCYVVPFMVKHLSDGNKKELLKYVNEFVNDYGDKFRSRYIQTTCTKFYLSNSPTKNKIYNSSIVFFFVMMMHRVKYTFNLIRFGNKHKIEKIRSEK